MKELLPTSLIIAATLLTCGAARAEQASFAVAVTLQAAAKPVAVEKLCPAAKPMQILGATVRVDCPAMPNPGTDGPSAHSGASVTSTLRRPEVMVTF